MGLKYGTHLLDIQPYKKYKSDHYGIEIKIKNNQQENQELYKSDHYGIEIQLRILFGTVR